MTTYPKPADPVSALTRAGGNTEAHSVAHGRTVGPVWENVIHYGAVDDGVTDCADAFDAAIAAAYPSRNAVLVPNGSYYLSRTVANLGNVKIYGTGSANCNINYGAYHAFTGGAQAYQGLQFTQAVGSASGSALKLTNASNITVQDIIVNGAAACTDPGIWLYGATSCHFDRLQVSGVNAHGIRLEVGGTFANANTIYRSRVNSIQGATNAGIYVEGSHNRVRDCVIEANRGYGVYSAGGNWNIIEGNWFEDNSGHNVLSANDLGLQIVNNKFHYQHNDIATADHIRMTQASANQRSMNRIRDNIFQDSSASGVYIRIGANVEYTVIEGNRGIHSGSLGGAILDSGTNTAIYDNDLPNAHSWVMPWNGLYMFGGNNTPEGAIAAPVGSVFLRTNGGTSTTLYVKQSGTGNTGWSPAIAASPSSAYTVTNPSTDRGLNVSADTTAQVAAVLGTLIADLQAAGILG